MSHSRNRAASHPTRPSVRGTDPATSLVEPSAGQCVAARVNADYAPPLTTLPDTDQIIGVTFAAHCTPAAGAEIVSLINFAAEPPPTFSDTRGNYVAGVVANGSVRIGPPRPPRHRHPAPHRDHHPAAHGYGDTNCFRDPATYCHPDAGDNSR